MDELNSLLVLGWFLIWLFYDRDPRKLRAAGLALLVLSVLAVLVCVLAVIALSNTKSP